MSNDRQIDTDSTQSSTQPTSSADDQSSSVAVMPRRRASRWALWFVISSFVLMVVLVLLVRFAALPLAVREANNWYSQQGEGYELTLDGWLLSLKEGQLSLAGLTLKHPGHLNGETHLKQVSIDLNLRALFNKQIQLQNLQLEGLNLAARQTAESIEVAGLTIPFLNEEPDSESTESSNGEGTESPSEWTFALVQPRLKDLKVQWQQPDLSTAVTLDSLTADRISTALDQSGEVAPFDISVSLNLQSLALTAPEAVRLSRPLVLDLEGQVLSWMGENAAFAGELSLGQLTVLWSGSGSGSGQGKDTAVQQLGWESLDLEGIKASASQQSLGSLLLKKLELVPEQDDDDQTPKGVVLEQLSIPNISFDGQSLSSGRIDLKGLSVDSGMASGMSGVEGGNEGSAFIGLPILSFGAASSGDSEITDSAATDSQAAETNTNTTELPVTLNIGGLRLEDFKLAWQQAELSTQIQSDKIEVGAVDSRPDQDGEQKPVTLAGGITVEQFQADQDGQQTRLEKPLQLSWNLAVEQWLNAPLLKGEVSIPALAVSLPDGIKISTGAMNLTELLAQTETATQTQQIAADFVLESLALSMPDQPDLSIGRISLSGIDASVEQQTLAALTLNGIQVEAKTSDKTAGKIPLLNLKQYQVPDIRFDGEHLNTGIHEILGLKLYATLMSNGAIEGLAAADSSTEQSTAAGDASSQADSSESEPVELPIKIQVAGIRIKANDDADRDDISQIFWRDQSVKPQVSSTVRVHSLETGALNSNDWLTQPDVDPVSVAALFSLDKYNRIKLKADMGKAKDELAGNVSLSVDQLDLVPFSPYMVQAIGYEAVQGMVQLSSDVKINDGQLDGKAKLRLKNSKFEPADKATIARVSKQISMPVETALSVLKDDNNNIKMDIPITGPIDDPDVGMDDLISQISKTAVRSATLYYLQQSLQPYGTLLSLASLASDALFSIRLDPLNYETGVSALTDAQTEYLTKVKDIMNSKTQLELRVCPFVSPAEVESQGDQWNRLALDRSTAVKDWLNQYKDEKDRSLGQRISLCTPRQGKTASVEMGF